MGKQSARKTARSPPSSVAQPAHPPPTERAPRVSALPAGPTAGIPDVVLRARRHLLGLYFLTGIAVATWLARLPSIRGALDLTTAGLGTVLVVGSIGSLLMVVVAGGLTNRWGSGRTLLVAAVLFSVANVLVGIGPAIGSVPVLAVGMLVSSSSYALGNVPLNLETVVIERAMGRTVVPQFHAAFSIGSVVGSLLGAGVSWLGVPVVWHFVGLSAVTFAWRYLAIPGAVLPLHDAPAGAVAGRVAAPDARPTPLRGASWRVAFAAWREPRTLVIGVIVLVASLSEGSANNWLSLGVVDGFGETEAVGAVTFGVFVGAMTVARLAGTWLIDRYGRVAMLVASGASSIVGLVLFATGPSLPLAAVGAAGWGLGAGLMVPIGMAAVSGDRLRMAGRVAVVSSFSSVASITAPPLIGLAAEGMGIRHALLLIVGGFVLSMALSRTVDTPQVVPAAVRPAPWLDEPDEPDLPVGRPDDAPARARTLAVGAC